MVVKILLTVAVVIVAAWCVMEIVRKRWGE
jgi:hypothetical protein